jgi:predicted PurR-regulated permease PerM
VDPVRVLDVTVSALSNIVTLLSFALLVVIVTAFMLVEATDVLDRRHRVLPPGLKLQLARIAREMQGWLWVKTVVSALTGLTAGLWVMIVGVDFAVLWGLVAFLLNYIPNLGSFIAAWPPVLLALIQFGPLAAGLVLVGYVVINVVFGSFLEPYLMGRQVGLSPLVVLLAVIAWGWMWGVAGMLLSVPITMAIKVGLEQSDDLRWIALLLGNGSHEPVAHTGPAAHPAGISSR